MTLRPQERDPKHRETRVWVTRAAILGGSLAHRSPHPIRIFANHSAHFGMPPRLHAGRHCFRFQPVQASLCSGRLTRMALMPLASALSARLSAMPALPKITTPPSGFGVSSIWSIALNPADLPKARQFG